MHVNHAQAELYLNDTPVGAVTLRGSDNSWGYGTFHPNDAFAAFAPLFGRWSLLIHADDQTDRLSPAASEELRRAEFAIDGIHAKLLWPDRREWIAITQLNIDGDLIEWKQAYCAK